MSASPMRWKWIAVLAVAGLITVAGAGDSLSLTRPRSHTLHRRGSGPRREAQLWLRLATWPVLVGKIRGLQPAKRHSRDFVEVNSSPAGFVVLL